MQVKTAEDILAHPRFAEARSAHVGHIVNLFAGNKFVTEMMLDAARIVLRGLVVSLHAVHDENDTATWATPSQLRKVIAGQGLASPRHVDDLLARFRQARYVPQVASSADKRVHILKPSPQMVIHDRHHLIAYHRFLLDLYPGRGYEWTLSGDPVVHFAIREAGLQALPQVMVFKRHAPLMMFLTRNAGFLAFLLAAQAELSGGNVRLPFTAIADRLRVSRTHIRNLFEEAEAQGNVRLEKRGGPVEIGPALWTAFDYFIADIQSNLDAIAQLAFANLRAEAR
jgi:hypothetical protein